MLPRTSSRRREKPAEPSAPLADPSFDPDADTVPADTPPPIAFGDGLARDDAGSKWVLLAHILRPQGRKGEVLAELLTDFPERFDGEPRVFLAKPGYGGRADEARSTKVSGFFLPVGKNQGRIVLHLEAANSIEGAAMLAGLDVFVPVEERLPLEEDASYISDLIGCVVSDKAGQNDGSAGIVVGTVDDVHLAMTADGTRRLQDAAPLLSVLSPSGAEILIPFAKAFLVEVDIAGKRIVMSLPAGLLEINT